MDRPGKRAKLSAHTQDVVRSLDRLGSISHKGLEELLRRVRATPEVLNVSRRELRDELHARFNEVRVQIRIALTDGTDFAWELAEPTLLLAKLIRDRPNVRHVFLDALREHPCSMSNPWHAVIGFDEFSPGDKLKVNNRRKSMVVSYTFLELGSSLLGNDALWSTPAVIRHATIQRIDGGWSHALKLFLNRMFFGTHGFLVTGVPIADDNGDTIAVVFATLGNMFSDGDGIRAAIDWKGASGMKPCFCHWNVLSKGSDLLEVGDPTYVDITCADHRLFRRWAPDELHSTVDMVNAAWRRHQAGTMTKAALERLEKASGFNATPFGLLGDVELRSRLNVFENLRYDWMHSALQNGTITEEIFLFTQAYIECRVPFFFQIQSHCQFCIRNSRNRK